MPLARRRGPAGDERDDRLLDVLLDVRGGLLLGRAADLADHQDRFGLRVASRTARSRSMKFVPMIGSPPMPTQVDLAEPEVAQLPDGFVGERAAAADDADLARLVDVAGHDADLALAGRDDAGAVRADQHGIGCLADQLVDPDHVEDRDALGDRDDRPRCRRRRPP